MPPPEPPVDECPACGSAESVRLYRATDRQYRTTDKEFDIVECNSCRLIRLQSPPPPAELATFYPDTYWFAPEEWTADRLEEIYRRFVLRDHLRFVRKAIEHSSEEGPVLDVGCGCGLFLRLMAESGFPVVGLDFSLDAAAVAWKTNGVPTVCAQLSNAPFPPESCAAVTMFHVLEHLYDPASYLEAAHRILKPDGRLVIQIPNAGCWQFLFLGQNWNGIDVPRHLFDLRTSDLEILLDHCGFEIVRDKYFSLRDNPAGMATSLAPELDPMIRRIRRVQETPNVKLFKDLAYFGLVLCCLPFTLIEAACRAGSTVMVEARKKA